VVECFDEDEIEDLWSSLHDALLRGGASHDLADDIAQETWLTALRNPPSEAGRMRGWLYVVSGRYGLDAQRSRQSCAGASGDSRPPSRSRRRPSSSGRA